MNYQIFSIILLCTVRTVKGADGYAYTEDELHKHLLENYNPDIIPKINKSEAITIDMELFLVAIEDIDEKRQTLTARLFLEMSWVDEFLTWESEKYQGVKTINVQNEAIWFPDITLKGTLDKPLDIGQAGGRAVVNNAGKVLVWPYKTHVLACNIAVSKFPLDKQTCKFDFSSWTNPTTIIRLRNPSENIQMSYYTESGEWEVVGRETELYQTTYGASKYDHMVFSLNLKRKWLFHALNNLAPVVCISLLNVFCFLMPVHSGERVTLCISIFLTLAVFLTVVNDAMPETSDGVAVFGMYVGLQLLGSALTIIMTVMSIFCYHRNDVGKVPAPLHCLVKVCRSAPVKVRKDHPKQIHIDEDSNTPLKANTGMQKLSLDVNSVHYKRVTWVMVSEAVDRMCFIGAICWHSFLTCFLLIGLNVS